MDLWCGIEPTISRIGDKYTSQLEKSGHLYRPEDIDKIAEIGFKAIRYPFLMEMLLENPDWTWIDERVKKLRENSLEIIATLLHHGFGTDKVNVLQEDFPERFAEYAKQVAERYPFINKWTPVNEPNTTARFMGLYGVWYPHKRDSSVYLRILINECKATILAMKEIRKVIPDAQLIQTEDMGKTYCTRNLLHQATFENHRRWLSLDLLTGRVDKDHPLWYYLTDNGLSVKEILWFKDNPCLPDVVGINYYITSERLLDDRLENYPVDYHWGSCDYADIEAARVTDILGHYGILKEVWERYKLTLALTEVHLNAEAESQSKWLYNAWNAGLRLQSEGVDFRAITIWSILGAFDWNSLLTKEDNYYEAGVFDVSSGKPEPTHLYPLVKELAKTGNCSSGSNCAGWWEKPERLLFSQEHEFERF